MWSKLASSFKSRLQDGSDSEPTSAPSAVTRQRQSSNGSTSTNGGEAPSPLREQHSGLSTLQPSRTESPHPDSPLTQTEEQDSPPTIRSTRNVFKLMSHRGDSESDLPARSISPFRSLSGIPKKVRSSLSLNTNGSQSSLARSTLGRSSSQDVLQPSSGSHRSSRTSQDTLPSSIESPFPGSDGQSRYSTIQANHPPSSFDPRMTSASVRSILREPNTPGTGQNVRFFAKDAFKVISPNESMASNGADPVHAGNGETEKPFLDTLRQAQAPDTASSNSGTFPLSSSKGRNKARPSVGEVFSPLRSIDTNADNSNIFDDSDAPKSAPAFGDGELDFAEFMEGADALTSTPNRNKSPDVTRESTVFHSMEQKERTVYFSPEASSAVPSSIVVFSPPAPPSSPPTSNSLRSRRSYSSSMASSSSAGSPLTPLTDSPITENDENSRPLSNILHKRSHSSFPLTPNPSKLKLKAKKRSRVMSDGVLRALSPGPEGDINDVSSPTFSFSSPGKINRAKTDEPAGVDPFSAEAKTFYPPALIPPTPPRGSAKSGGRGHNRSASKEESVIVTLQAQLALQADLLIQYKADLAAREEMVSVLETKMRKVDEDETKKRTVLKAWKKKVAELERVCRSMEDEVERSREERLERSVMDEASGEALRHMHRQIAELERTIDGIDRERKTWQTRCEQAQGKLLRAEEMERELRQSITQVRQDMDTVGGTSIGSIAPGPFSPNTTDEGEQGHDKHHQTDSKAQEERVKLLAELEALKNENAQLHDLVADKDDQLASKDEELQSLQSEVEAQWVRTEQTGETMAKMSRDLANLREENHHLHETKDNLEAHGDQLQSYAHELEADKERLANEWADLEQQLGALEDEKRRFEQKLEDSEGTSDELITERNELRMQVAQLQDRLSYANKASAELEAERNAFKADMEALETRMAEMEEEWTEAESRKSELEAEAQELWVARDELEAQIAQARNQISDLELKTQEQEHRLSTMALEGDFAKDHVARLEANATQRAAELAEVNESLRAKEDELENMRDDISNLSRDHSRLVNSQSREMAEHVDRVGESRKQVEDLIRSQARAEAENKTLNDRVRSLSGELDRIRKLVHNLQHESADKDLRLSQAQKLHEKDVEEMKAYNIALDSKQQELELMKRKQGVRGTAGSTPAGSNATSTLSHRRDSLVSNGLITPATGPIGRSRSSRPLSMTSRPSSVASDISSASVAKPMLSTRRPSTETPSTTTRSASGSTISKPSTLNKGAAASTTVKPKVAAAPRASTGTPVSATKSSLNRSTSRTSLPSVPVTPVVGARKVPSVAGRALTAARKSMASPVPSTTDDTSMSDAEPTPMPIRKVAAPA